MGRKQAEFGAVWLLLLSLLLAPFFYSALFSFPEGDDFAPALKAMFLFDPIGGIDNMFSAWWKWSGRYTFSFLWVFLGDVAEYRGTYIASIFLSFAVLWLSVFGIVRELGKDVTKTHGAFWATFWLFAVLCTHGTVSQWYLLVELETLIAGYTFTLVYIWSLCRLWNRPDPTRGAKWFAIFSCVFAAGLYEHSAPLVMAISVAAWLLSVIYDHPNRKIYLLLVKISVVCFLIMYLARGNFRRQTKRGLTFALMLEQLKNAGLDWWKYILPAYCNPVYLAALFVAAWLPPRWKTPLTDKLPAPLILGGSLVLFLGFSFALTLVHALSDVTVGETGKIPANIVQYSVVFVFFALFSCRDWLRLHAVRFLGKPLTLLAMLAVLLAGDSNFSPVFWNAVSGETARYGAAYEKRKAVMAKHAGETLAVMPFFTAPLPIPFDSLVPGTKSWPNKYAAPFYKLKGLEALPADVGSAFGSAFVQVKLVWNDAGSGLRFAYVPSLELPGKNETYRFDWVFIESETGTPPRVRVMNLGEGRLADTLGASPEMMERLAEGRWPFRRIFQAPPLTVFEVAGRKFFAVPLPLQDTAAAGAADQLFIRFDSQKIIPVKTH